MAIVLQHIYIYMGPSVQFSQNLKFKDMFKSTRYYTSSRQLF